MNILDKRNKARQRAGILWEHYNSQGRLNLADIKRLIGVPFASLYTTFDFHKIEAPPVWDSQTEKIRRKANLLNAEARRLGQDFLTEQQAAKALGVTHSRLRGVLTQIEKQGVAAIEIRGEVKLPVTEQIIAAKHPFALVHGHINYKYHPTGFEAYRIEPGPDDGEVTYYLR